MTDFCIAIENLEPFMTKKYFNYFVHYLPKSITIINHEIHNHLGFPFIAYIYFENSESKEEFIQKFDGKNFTQLNKKIDINKNPEDVKNLNLQKEINNENVISYKSKYEKMADENFEKNFTDDGLIFIDFETIQKQRDSVTYLVKKVGQHLLKGESIMNISLPVFMFDERSLLQTYEKVFFKILIYQ